MIRAFIFLKMARDGDPRDTIKMIRQIPGVVSADLLYGPDDGLVNVEAPDLDGLWNITSQIREIPGVQETDTRLIA